MNMMTDRLKLRR